MKRLWLNMRLHVKRDILAVPDYAAKTLSREEIRAVS